MVWAGLPLHARGSQGVRVRGSGLPSPPGLKWFFKAALGAQGHRSQAGSESPRKSTPKTQISMCCGRSCLGFLGKAVPHSW